MSMINECHSPSLKHKLKSSICCFPSSHHHETLGGSDDSRRQLTPRSPYAWLKSTAQEFEIKEKCWGLIGRRGKNRRRHNSADFRYDAASYSLNFEDDIHKEDELPLNNFTARLPATPDRFTEVVPPRRVLIAL
ncbi:uncharacterized protein LOC8274225 [Ricinus communis]|uniref:Uncharacterized protein n=1 Tax=Ricinus communis TaxID=3988 RepID=B9RNZ8_RICCO|nr:uncharacterized protein LOC8274225 [Ricinus communis]EEF46916.1 conserved hypothetical protein [Ricinus communis]|eukprot:XP_015572502.1 uncharacterized protein LOC8274225 [Ricinus communis]